MRFSQFHNTESINRRAALGRAIAAVGTAAAIQEYALAESSSSKLPHIATNTYPWLTFAKRDKAAFQIHSPGLLSSIAATGITGYEPIIERPDDFTGLADQLNKNGLSMKSVYVNSMLHDPERAENSINQVKRIAAALKPLGTSIVVTNPSPIRWGGDEDKSDAQLSMQAKSLDRLGKHLREQGQILAYHNHDAELRRGGREFHHMLTSTAPENVKLCLDAHWIFRGCGDSSLAVFDVVQHYHQRIVELHLRQSQGGTWTEDFQMKGDLAYDQLFEFLSHKGIQPHLVLEQAVEAESPQTMTAEAAHKISHSNLTKYLSQAHTSRPHPED